MATLFAPGYLIAPGDTVSVIKTVTDVITVFDPTGAGNGLQSLITYDDGTSETIPAGGTRQIITTQPRADIITAAIAAGG